MKMNTYIPYQKWLTFIKNPKKNVKQNSFPTLTYHIKNDLHLLNPKKNIEQNSFPVSLSPYLSLFSQMRENTDQKNTKYGHFLHSDACKDREKIWRWLVGLSEILNLVEKWAWSERENIFVFPCFWSISRLHDNCITC